MHHDEHHKNSDDAAAVLPARYPLVDALRGTAVLLMVIYHFSFDLNYFKQVHFDFYHDPFWLGFRTLIVSLFLLLVGVSLHLATRFGLDRRRYLRRLALLACCALLVSLGSYLVFPASMIYFGILHFIFFASLLGLVMLRFYWINLIAGLGLIMLGWRFQHPLFDLPALQWIGLMTHKPITEDYVPLLPWFGVVMIGLFLGRKFFNGSWVPVGRWQGRWQQALMLGGRHSLLIYMIHQPLLFGLLYLLIELRLPA